MTGMCVRMTPVTVREPAHILTTPHPCDDGLYCTQIDECQNGLCIGRDDPCLDNGDYCDGVEYCQEDVSDFICNSTGDPCDVALTCDEASDVCDVSDVTVIVADAFGYSGTIDLELNNFLDSVREVHVDICDRDQRSWLDDQYRLLQHHHPEQCLHLRRN